MGIHTFNSIHQPIIVRNPEGFLTITDRPPIRRCALREIEVLPKTEKPPEGLLATIAGWISEAVKSIFGKTPEQKTKEITLLPSQEINAESEAAAMIDDLRLTTSDKVHTWANIVHWGVAGAALYGIAPQYTGPISLIASLGADTISFLSLPEDTSWLRRLFSLPGVAKTILNYNPWIAKLSQITSLFNHVQHATYKLAAAGKAFKTHPKEALKAGFAHSFNLASSAAFTADSLGLINLHKAREEPTPQKCLRQSGYALNQCKRKIVLGSAYSNNGDPQRDRYSTLVDSTHAEYAKKWGAVHVVNTDTSLLKGQCRDPRILSGLLGFNNADCSPYWLKIPTLKEWLEEPKDPNYDEEWRFLIDDDMPVTNMNIDPNDAIDSLRAESGNTSVILARDPHSRPLCYTSPLRERAEINGGLWLVRKDAKALDFINQVWETRQLIHKNLESEYCPTLGLCMNQDSLHEQQGTGIVLLNDLSLIDRVVSSVRPRDEHSSTRGHIALNTFYGHDNECYKRDCEKWSELPYIHSISTYNKNDIWKKGDWMGQAAAIPVRGKQLPVFGKNKDLCVDLTPLDFSEVRHDKLKEMIDHTVR